MAPASIVQLPVGALPLRVMNFPRRFAAVVLALLTLCAAGPSMAQTWAEKPEGAEMRKVYPPAAVEANKEGLAKVRCRIVETGRLADCAVVSEDPPGLGFGAAALALAPKFRADLSNPENGLSAGRVVTIPVRFAIPGVGPPSPAERPQIMRLAWMALIFATAAGLIVLLFVLGQGRDLVAALTAGGGLIPAVLRQAPVPFALFVPAAMLGQLPMPIKALALLVGAAAFLMVIASSARVAFHGRGPFVLKRRGFQFGRIELRILAASFGFSLACLMAMLPILLLMALTSGMGSLLGGKADLATGVLGLALLVAITYVTARMMTLLPATLRHGGLQIGAAWRAGRGHVLAMAPGALLYSTLGLTTSGLGGRLLALPDATRMVVVGGLALIYGFGMIFAVGMVVEFYRRFHEPLEDGAP